ncbi:hypothetical protein FPSE_07638 [Fusarium pseudograminearum CS3096]|uniref:Uncharacterized protein n=1 Tax=Fusarium pseudograminearum (strain CS3096) TaxID=1028729 RepID=K3UJP2_FUSPC|nr:hypothetical protein FPSE_07638 [Fusarium pseudograminearum CS3096]EKJ72181.1 hypothetical protein FPSE_07638 [Fusarium pseudograminearum CS3096]
MTVPFVEVSHLASSSSFYSATLQILGLRYLNESRDPSSSIGTVTYGLTAGVTKTGGKHRQALTDGRGEEIKGPQPVLQIREVSRPFDPVRISTVVIAVPAPGQIVDFYEAALTANPWLAVQADSDPTYSGSPRLGIDGGEPPRRATVRDLDGNTIQVVYRQPTCPRDYYGRVIEWTYDGASHSTYKTTIHTTRKIHTRNRSLSQPQLQPVASARSSSSSIDGLPPFQPRQSSAKHGPNTVTAAEMAQRAAAHPEKEDEPVSVSPRQSSNNNGLSTTTVVGAILGVAAAGAALTYGFASHAAKERERKPRQEYEGQAPQLPRRSTFPEKAPPVHKLHQEERRTVYGDYPPNASQYPPKALPYRGHGGFPTPDVYPEGYPFQQNMQNDYAPRKMSHHNSYPPKNLGYTEEDSSEDSPDEPPPRQIQYLTQVPYNEENPWASNTRARSRSRTRSVAKSTARSVAANSAAPSTRTVTKSTARSVAPSRARSPSQAPDEGYETTRSRRPSRQPEDTYEFDETRSRHTSRVRDDGFEPRSGRSSRPPPSDVYDRRSRRSSRPPPEDGFERSRRSSRPPVTEKPRSMRARSEVGAGRSKSVVLADDLQSEVPFSRKYDDRQSHAGSRPPKSSRSVVRGNRPTYDDERTYVSTRSRPSSRAPRRSSRTEVDDDIMEAPEVPEVPDAPEIPLDPNIYEVPDDMMPRGQGRSRYNMPRMASGPEYQHMGFPGKAQSYVSARDVCLPMSGVGSSHAEWDDDMVSVAPSDSISCVGMKPSRRSRKIR